MTTPKMCGKCYECQYRRDLPGDAHSRCAHPKVVEVEPNDNMFSLMAAAFKPEMVVVGRELNIVADAHGVQSGWFTWPGNFDPTWLENCDGFTAKQTKVA